MARFLQLSASCVLLGMVLFALGWTEAPEATRRLADWLEVGMLIVTSPSDLLTVRLKLGGAFALAPFVSWLALLFHRIRGKHDPSSVVFAVYLMIPIAAVALGMSLRALWYAQALGPELPPGIDPMIHLVQLSPGSGGVRAVLAVGVVLWAVVLATARTRSRTSPSASA